jgi:hypothetical protein
MHNRIPTVVLIGLLVLPLAFTTAHSFTRHETVSSTINTVKLVQDYGKLPMSFQPNKGQFEGDAKFASRGLGYSLSIHATGLRLKFRDGSASHANRFEMRLVGANPDAQVRGTNPLPGEANYFSGQPENWITHVPTYAKVAVEEVYPGIDAVYYGNQNRFEYDFIVKPGAWPDRIDIAVDGASKLSLDSGDLVISFGDRGLRLSGPTFYQEIDGRRSSVSGHYILRDRNRVGFEISDYDHNWPLIIDPQIVYSVLTNSSRPYGIAVDPAGSAYICGTGVDGGPEDSAVNAFVSKINRAGAQEWFNSFGSLGYSDTATAIAVDAAGNSYVTGWTFYDLHGPLFKRFPTLNAIQPNPRGNKDAFVTKFDTLGKMVYSTYLGGSNDDRADGIAIDSLGNVYVSGQTYSTDFPTSKPFQPTLHGTSNTFVTVLNAQGTAFIYSTYVGGSGMDAATALALDASGNAYVTGFTTSLDFPTVYPIRAASSGGLDSFVFKLNPAGSALLYSTYLGGSADDVAKGIAVDASNNTYVTGRTHSTNFPTVSAFQPTLHGGVDAFVTKINSTGTAFLYSTYLGGANDETTGGIWCAEKPTCGGITVNSNGNAYVTGVTASPDFPQVRSTQGFRGITDAYIVEFSADGKSLVYSTLMGGAVGGDTNEPPNSAAFSSGSAVAYSNGNLYVAGLTISRDFPVTSTAVDLCCVNPVWNGIDGFVAKLADDTSPTFRRVEQNSSVVTYTGTWYSNTGSFNSGGTAVLAVDKGSRATFTFTGTDARWIGYKDAWSGIANVYVDGVLRTQVDAYSASDQPQAAMYTISGLSNGSHTLTVEVSGTRNPSSHSNWIWVDAFDYASGNSNGGGRAEQNNSAVAYTGAWYSNSGSFNSGGSAVLALNSGARATFTFTGTAVGWIGYRDSWSGIANVYIDGTLKAQVDTYAASSQAQVVNYTLAGLSPGTHTITIEVSGNKNTAAQSAWVWVDAFDYM